jgi:glycosyltransferase involved in cell wall biosynthesis
MIYRLFLLKRQIENIFIFPFILIGRLIGSSYRKGVDFDLLLIFPFYHTGGAEKVHSLIANTFKDKKALILFTRKSKDNRYLHSFQSSGHQIIDISRYTDNKFMYWNNLIYRGIIASLVNRQRKAPIIFNGQSNFGYKLSPWINKEIVQIELIHAFSSFSWIRIPFIKYYAKTVMISRYAINEHKQQYNKLGIPDNELNKIQYITNGIAIPTELTRPVEHDNILHVLYVGRSTLEKRVNLIAQIAQQASTNHLDVKFSMVGDVKEDIESTYHPFIHFYGPVNNEVELFKIYQKHDVLIMTSLHEGFPISIMEAMSAGCAILSTPVGDIPYHVKHEKNGFLFSSTNDETIIKTEALDYLSKILNDPSVLNQISINNQRYAQEEFELSIFEKRYQSLLSQKK